MDCPGGRADDGATPEMIATMRGKTDEVIWERNEQKTEAQPVFMMLGTRSDVTPEDHIPVRRLRMTQDSLAHQNKALFASPFIPLHNI